jgi:hypothetical protein
MRPPWFGCPVDAQMAIVKTANSSIDDLLSNFHRELTTGKMPLS